MLKEVTNYVSIESMLQLLTGDEQSVGGDIVYRKTRLGNTIIIFVI